MSEGTQGQPVPAASPGTTGPATSGRRAASRRSASDRLNFGVLPSLVGYNLRRAQLAVFQNFQQAMAELDVTPGQLGVLVLIGENDGLSQSRLGRALGIDRSTMVAVIDRLEKRRLVRRAPSPTDRRSYALELTSEGRALLAAVTPRLRAHEQAITGDLDAAEQATLLGLLRRLAR